MSIPTRILLAGIALMLAVGCSYATGGKAENEGSTVKGAKEMTTHYMGRFAIDVPAGFKLTAQAHEFRLVKIKEIPVPNPRIAHQFAEQKWIEILSEIQKQDKPSGVKDAVIEQHAVKDVGTWAKCVLYYSDYMTEDEASFDILVDYGQHLTLFNIHGRVHASEEMSSWVMEVVRAYRSGDDTPKVPSAFFTQRGHIDLPYKQQESTYARFEGPMEMVLTVEMMEIHGENKQKGLLLRTTDAIAAGYMKNLHIKKIGGGNRVAAGLQGEEEILQGQDGDRKHLRFDWDHLGKAESGNHPAVQINIETTPEKLLEKKTTWDAILSSFRPLKGEEFKHAKN